MALLKKNIISYCEANWVVSLKFIHLSPWTFQISLLFLQDLTKSWRTLGNTELPVIEGDHIILILMNRKAIHNSDTLGVRHTCLIEARLYGNCRSWWVRKAGWKHTVWKENDEGKVMDIPAAHNDAQGLSVMRSAPKLRPRTPMSGLVLPSCAQRRPWPAQAGTGTCVHIPIQLIPIASLAWLGKQQPCPLLSVGCMGLLETECDTHTHTHGLHGKVEWRDIDGAKERRRLG